MEKGDENTSKYWYNKGVELSESNKYENALRAYNQALAFDDKDPDIWNNKCYVLIKLGRYEEAINAGKIGVHLAPNDPELWDTLRDAYIRCNNQEKADECQKNAFKIKNLGGKPIDRAPTLSTVNGVGRHIYGDTIYFVVFFIPIFPIARYSVEEVSTFSFRFYGKLDLHPWQKIWQKIFVAIVVAFIGSFIIMMLLRL